MRVIRASELSARRCEWDWPWWLAPGKLAMLDGDPGLGKSLLTLDLCARLSTGRPMPDGSAGPPPSNVMILHGDREGADILRPRLEALGADLDRVLVIDADQTLDALPLFPAQTAALHQKLEETQARLLVLDPVVAFLERSAAANNDQCVRRALLPLAALAESHRCSVLLVRHLTKRAGRRALYRGCGSIGLAAVCRTIWLLAQDPQDSGRRVLAQVKNNLAPLQPSRSLAIQSGSGGLPDLAWLGTSPLTADDLVGGLPATGPVTAQERACNFLLEFLRDSPQPTRLIWKAGQAEKLSQRTLQMVCHDLEISTRWVVIDGIPRAYWALPGQKVPDPSDTSLEQWLAPLREKYPVKTPLEEDD